MFGRKLTVTYSRLKLKLFSGRSKAYCRREKISISVALKYFVYKEQWLMEKVDDHIGFIQLEMEFPVV